MATIDTGETDSQSPSCKVVCDCIWRMRKGFLMLINLPRCKAWLKVTGVTSLRFQRHLQVQMYEPAAHVPMAEVENSNPPQQGVSGEPDVELGIVSHPSPKHSKTWTPFS